MGQKQYDAVIIGAGIAGLVAALKLSKKGKRVVLLERQAVPGGYAASFKRKNFTFEAAIHCVDDLAPDGYIREFLDEYGISQRIDYIELKHFARVLFPEHDFVADFNPDNFINYLKSNFPDESKAIDNFFSLVRKFYKQIDDFTSSELPLWVKLLLSPFRYNLIVKSSMMTAKGILDKFFKSNKLKSILSEVWRYSGLAPSELSAFYFLITFYGYYCHPTASVKGGFTHLFEVIVDEIRKNGSEVMFNTSANSIVTDNGRRVKSVVTDKGEVFDTKVVISNANPFIALTKLLDNQRLRDFYIKKLSSMDKTISAVQVYLGLKLPAKDLGMSHFMLSVNATYDHEDTFKKCMAGDYADCSFAIVDHAQIDSTLVPEGKGSLVIMTFDSYKNWRSLKGESYKARKEEVANELIKRSEKYLPGLSNYIEVMEVATPLTFERYTLSPEGAIYGFAQTMLQSSINRIPLNTKVKGLFLTGSWTKPGHGVHGCFISGIDAADFTLKFLR